MHPCPSTAPLKSSSREYKSRNKIPKLSPRMDDVPEADRVDELFNRQDPKFPIVETIPYRSRVAWQKGRPAWLSDYAAHYKTSRHFIARSLNEGSRLL